MHWPIATAMAIGSTGTSHKANSQKSTCETLHSSRKPTANIIASASRGRRSTRSNEADSSNNGINSSDRNEPVE